MLNFKNQDVIVEQQEELDSRGRQTGSSSLETSEASDIGSTQIPVPGEKMPVETGSFDGQLGISTVECIPVLETDFIENDETQLAKSDLTSEIQGNISPCSLKKMKKFSKLFFLRSTTTSDRSLREKCSAF